MNTVLQRIAFSIFICVGSTVSVQASENYPAQLQGNWLAAAKAGNADAQYAMGKSKCCGYGNVYNDSDAMEWFCKAAVQGHRDAQFEMGRQLEAMTERRQVAKASVWNRESYAWYSLAAKQGHAMAELNRRTLQNHLGPRQQHLAEQRINEVMATRCSHL